MIIYNFTYGRAACFPLHQLQKFLSLTALSVQDSFYENAIRPSSQKCFIEASSVCGKRTRYFCESACRRISRVLNGWPTDSWESRKIHVRSAKKRCNFGLKFLRKHNCHWAKQVHLRNARTLYRKGWDTYWQRYPATQTYPTIRTEWDTHLRYSPTREIYSTIRNIQIYISAR